MLNFLQTHTSSPVHQGNYKHETLLPGELALCLYQIQKQTQDFNLFISFHSKTPAWQK